MEYIWDIQLFQFQEYALMTTLWLTVYKKPSFESATLLFSLFSLFQHFLIKRLFLH